MPGEAVVFSSTDPGQTLGTVADGGDGAYTVEVTSSTTVGAATITATDESVGPAVSASATLSQVSPPLTMHPPAITPPSVARDSPAVVRVSPPLVRISRTPSAHAQSRPYFEFVSDQPGATFVCEVDYRGPPRLHVSKEASPARPGSARFTISAVGADGQVGSAATHKFFVKPRRTSR